MAAEEPLEALFKNDYKDFNPSSSLNDIYETHSDISIISKHDGKSSR